MVNQILFNLPLTNEGLPLFKNQSQLAELLLKDGDSKYFLKEEELSKYNKSFIALKNYLSQVLKGKRPISDDLLKSLSILVKKRISSNENYDEIIFKIKKSFETLVDKPLFTYSGVQHLIGELNTKTAISLHQIVFTPRTLETYNNLSGNPIRNNLIENLKIHLNHFKINECNFRYEFHFPNNNVATEFFKSIIDSVNINYKIEKNEIISRLEILEHNNLQSYIVESIYTVFPHSVFDIDSSNACGFIIYVPNDESLNITKMSTRGVQRWYEEFYLPIKNKNKRVRFHFKDCANLFRDN